MEENVKKGVQYMLIASFLFALMGITAKELSDHLSTIEIVFFRNVFGVFIILFSIYKSPLNQIGGKFWLLIFRGTIGFAALLFFFYNIANIPLGEAMTFSKTSTIFTALLAYFFLKEHIGFKGWIGVFIGFIGILFIAEFDGSTLKKTDYLGILSGVGAALAYTSIRELRKFYDGRAIVLSFMAVGTIFPLIFMIISEFYSNPNLDFMLGKFIMPNPNEWIIIILLGLFSTYAQIYMTKAYASAKAGIVGTVSYSNIIFSIFLGLLMGDAFPSFIVLFGIILIILSGLMVSKK
ncbi:DMT family transporter [Arcobacter porcinus]|uniref:EamA-like transporter family protein n=1 Tax=Arcobacter porcinus TaxID=1935204 RepID=A0ABX2YBK0_9BACT|nr:DMT family transporter [Arcobacter porcinus]OCL81801.1 EamA-like transporter family protein [Arcobacter porcinus]OCL85409.1 EamA-like transporter family protein [Arcobacter porcinus]OCL90798.1 EamA-like transporter family protein [Arcobacter porcinus]